ncbi:MAG: hypothetical protein UT41_C0001G0076 [Candidatus Wolfebacteria bacterium GW2011_GWC2_39_22]|uniref:Uncharacterized protein n=1 Tax=Candidatus Wolfebacteria bacterium GW2011_GWC2_39_22 TaxID=1619013 RepID=A0A0G0RFT9_9BACT|nr:MAG: hypothetical protein UT41_C0001G0076 [Candidatus Wolfebacteria bacterium GW2011_GWC2_39_22]HBI25736.1 hypothetical protein [Candidatus Wolfebacteria bacterium]
MNFKESILKYRIAIVIAVVVVTLTVLGIYAMMERTVMLPVEEPPQSSEPIILTPELTKVLIKEMSVPTTTEVQISKNKIEEIKKEMSVDPKRTPPISNDTVQSLLDSMSAK